MILTELRQESHLPCRLSKWRVFAIRTCPVAPNLQGLTIVWSVHLDPELPSLSDTSVQDNQLVSQIYAGKITPQTWVSHPAHTAGKILQAMQVSALRKIFVQVSP